jgi:hypothetical protein
MIIVAASYSRTDSKLGCERTFTFPKRIGERQWNGRWGRILR